VTFQPKRRYKLTGDYSEGVRTFTITDVVSDFSISPPVNIGSFAPVAANESANPR
jgi:hypothetical protein